MVGAPPAPGGAGGDNGVNGHSETPGLDNMKHSPATAPATPRDGDPAMADFNMSNFSQGGSSVSSEESPWSLSTFQFYRMSQKQS